ncbi:uncharacterized protein EKO05_0008776 [Ascochyta rabiei]|uniref:uncharacterized protein n=1 Tax=Didymella rabiei TaxID=5454 RepID=UPI00220BB219|nr:uncharacterized protein EKO05_0008776 [Ascochyta rabiei]UPX18477.1 hypothetical protein EKO05_0008776 [Ascochyta rabiei]
MSAMVQARTAQVANGTARQSVMSAREQAQFTRTESAHFRIQATMHVTDGTCNLGERERLTQGFLGSLCFIKSHNKAYRCAGASQVHSRR